MVTGIVTGGTTTVAVVVKVVPLSIKVTSEVSVDPGSVVTEPGNVVTEPGSSVVTVTAGCVVVKTSVVVNVFVVKMDSSMVLTDTVT